MVWGKSNNRLKCYTQLHQNKIMTENQFNQLFGLVTKSVESTQRLEKTVAEMKQDISGLKEDVSGLKQDVSGLKQDVSELKVGQAKLEEGQAEIKQDISEIKKEMKIMRHAMDDLAKDAMITRARVGVLEDELPLSN
ncbi:MAG TPA: hypothetical protein PKY59_27635 [Pyrinomonadaceae bacterium]|nr:hypothetical protein [Pyrinomonadaceae bacterium]